MPVDMLHLLAVAGWLGGLAALLVALHRTPDVTDDAVRRFSRVAFGSVLVLAATGLYQSWRQVGSWSALTGTRYGQLLLVKVALVAVLVGVAWVSRRWTARLAERTGPAAPPEAASTESEPAVPDSEGDEEVAPERAAQLSRQRAALTATKEKRARDADPDRSGLRRSVMVETGIAVVLLVVTTILTSTEPGRTEEEAARGSTAAAAPATGGEVNLSLPFDTGGQNGKGTVRLDISPGGTGANSAHVWIDGPDGRPLDVPEVKLAFTLESKDIGPLPVVPDRLTEGHWTASGVQIPMAGDWKIAVTVRTSDIDQTTIDKNVKIG